MEQAIKRLFDAVQAVQSNPEAVQKAALAALRAALRDGFRRELMQRAPHLYSAAERERCGVALPAPIAALPPASK